MNPPAEKSLTWEQAVQWLREQPDLNELARACYFDDPLPEAAERFRQSSEWQAMRELLPEKKGAALDLGAGRGISSHALAREGWQVTALEPDPSPLVGAEAIRALFDAAGLPVTIVTEYSEKLPFPDNHFDLVNARQVLHHARNLRQTCREIFRVLKPGGRLIATREHVVSRKEDLPLFFQRHPLHKWYGGEHAFMLKEYLAAFREAGLKAEKIFAELDSPINYFPLTLNEAINNRLGKWASSTLFDTRHSLGRRACAAFVRWNRLMDATPGRLYSFVTVKPLSIPCAA